jgi:predicted dehydrogenase
VAACDPVLDRAKKFAPFATTEPGEAIERADAVLVATPPSITPQMAILALDAGKDVLCEKPIAETPNVGWQVLEAARRSSGKFQVGFIYRHLKAVKRMSEVDVGRPVVARFGLFSEAWVSDEHEKGIADYLKTSSPMVVGGAHLADLLCHLVKSRPEHAQGAGAKTRDLPGPNHEMATVTFQDGSLGLLEVGWLHPAINRDLKYPISRLCEFELIGPKGSVRYEWDTGRLRIVTNKVVEEKYPVQDLDFDAQLEAFLTEPFPGIREAYRSLLLTHAIAQSRRSGLMIDIS